MNTAPMKNSDSKNGGFTYRSPFPPLAKQAPPLSSLPSFLLQHHPHPSRPAFISSQSGETLTFGDLASLVASAGGALSGSGVSAGDIVLLVSPNSILFPAVCLAVMSIGAVFSTANPLLTRGEILSQIESATPAVIVTTRELLPKVEGLIPRPPLLVESLLTHSGAHTAALPSLVSPAALMHSSGTTGRTKGVLSTHQNLIHVASALRSAWAGGEHMYLCAVPLSHMFGFSVFICGALAAGASVVVMDRYSPEGLLRAVDRWQVTRIPAVPPMVLRLARCQGFKAGFDLRSLREVICSGAPLRKECIRAFAASFPDVILSQCYGLTESSGPLTLCDGLKGKVHHSIGRLIPSLEAKIIDARTGNSLSPNNLGELCVRGPSIMQGYLNNPEATSLAIDQQGWLHTGDLCYIDDDGLIYIVDRIKELIKYKAYQVAPIELEEILATHPGVEDVAVTSFPDEEAGEIPVACVVRKAGFTMHEDELIDFMDNKVAPYKRIRKVIFVKLIPRTPSGKVIRRHLKNLDFFHERLEISARL